MNKIRIILLILIVLGINTSKVVACTGTTTLISGDSRIKAVLSQPEDGYRWYPLDINIYDNKTGKKIKYIHKKRDELPSICYYVARISYDGSTITYRSNNSGDGDKPPLIIKIKEPSTQLDFMRNEVEQARVVRNKELVFDTWLGLIWEDTDHAQGSKGGGFIRIANENERLKFDQAKSYCKELSIRGLENFRLPTDAELQSLSRIEENIRYRSSDAYWSSTLIGGDRIARRYLISGESNDAMLDDGSPVRCVSGNKITNFETLIKKEKQVRKEALEHYKRYLTDGTNYSSKKFINNCENSSLIDESVVSKELSKAVTIKTKLKRNKGENSGNFNSGDPLGLATIGAKEVTLINHVMVSVDPKKVTDLKFNPNTSKIRLAVKDMVKVERVMHASILGIGMSQPDIEDYTNTNIVVLSKENNWRSTIKSSHTIATGVTVNSGGVIKGNTTLTGIEESAIVESASVE